MPPSGAVIFSRVSVILLSSLARDAHREFWGVFAFPANETARAEEYVPENSTCHDPCAGLQHSVTVWMALAPFGIALLFVLAAALPVSGCLGMPGMNWDRRAMVEIAMAKVFPCCLSESLSERLKRTNRVNLSELISKLDMCVDQFELPLSSLPAVWQFSGQNLVA